MSIMFTVSWNSYTLFISHPIAPQNNIFMFCFFFRIKKNHVYLRRDIQKIFFERKRRNLYKVRRKFIKSINKFL
jgi:hypothetical protein